MARARSVSSDRVVGHRARDSMHRSRLSHSPVGSSQIAGAELQAVIRARAKSASPGPALITTRRTLRKSDGTTPVLPTPSPSGLVQKNRVVKQKGKPRSQRGRSKDGGGDAFGPLKEEFMVPVQGLEALERNTTVRGEHCPSCFLYDIILLLLIQPSYPYPINVYAMPCFAGSCCCASLVSSSY